MKMKEVIEKINKKMNINDFVSLLQHYEELNKEFDKSKKILEKEGIPRFYIRVLVQIENCVTNFSAEDKKKLNQNNNKSFNTLKQKIKKHNLLFTKEINEFLQNPVDSDDEKKKKRVESF